MQIMWIPTVVTIKYGRERSGASAHFDFDDCGHFADYTDCTSPAEGAASDRDRYSHHASTTEIQTIANTQARTKGFVPATKAAEPKAS